MEYMQLMEPWMIPIIIMICVTIIVIVSSVTKIITTSIENKNKSGELTANKEFINALREFKEHIEFRVGKLEKNASWQDPDPVDSPITQKKDRQKTIELDLDEGRPENGDSIPSEKLKNMLNK